MIATGLTEGIFVSYDPRMPDGKKVTGTLITLDEDSQEIIDEKLQDLLNDVKRDPEAYLENYGLLAENFIDKDSFVQGVIDSDGYGMLSSYDGSYDISKVRGTDYYIMRID